MNVLDLVRSLYGDMTPDDQGNFLFSDEVIDGWLTLAGGSAYRAAAIALRALAADQAYLLKVVRTDDLQVDGRAVAAELRQLADDYDQRAREDDTEGDGTFDIVAIGKRSLCRPEATTWPVWSGCP